MNAGLNNNRKWFWHGDKENHESARRVLSALINAYKSYGWDAKILKEERNGVFDDKRWGYVISTEWTPIKGFNKKVRVEETENPLEEAEREVEEICRHEEEKSKRK